MFQDVCERAGFGRDWAPRDLRHTFGSLLSDDGMAIEKIVRLVGHASSHVTETVYRQELRSALQGKLRGTAGAFGRLCFPPDNVCAQAARIG